MSGRSSDVDDRGYAEKESRLTRHTPSKKSVMTDEILKKGHAHLKENKAHRTNYRQQFRNLDLSNIDEFDDDFYSKD